MDHDERWEAIRKSHLSSLYLDEAKTLLITIIEASEHLTEIVPIDLGDMIKVDAEVAIHANALIAAAGRLQGLLSVASRRSGESQKRFELRTRRVGWLRDEGFANIDVSILDDRGVRNAIEHFDDRLDEVAERAADGAFEFPLYVPTDLAVGHDQVLTGLFDGVETPPKTVQPVRMYVANTKTFHVLRWSFSVEAVAQSCKDMLERLADHGWVDGRTVVERGGSILIQGERPTVTSPQ